MTLRLNPQRQILGLYGLALLRGWPYEDPAQARRHIAAIRAVLDGGSGADDLLDVEDLDLDAAYAAWSPTYDTLANALIEAEEPVVHRLLNTVEPCVGLDVGCGTGRFASLLRDVGHEMVGIDPSDAMLRQAHAKSIPVVRADARRLPARDGCAGLVVCGLALTHLPELGVPMHEIARVLSPGGTAILTDVHPFAVELGAQAMFTAEDGSRGVARNLVHPPSAYVNAAVSAGLTVDRCEEVLANEAFVEELPAGPVRDAGLAALLGFPLVLAWRLRKP